MPADGSAEWIGDEPTGTGTFTAGDTISGGYTYKSSLRGGPGVQPLNSWSRQSMPPAFQKPSPASSPRQAVHLNRFTRTPALPNQGSLAVRGRPGLRICTPTLISAWRAVSGLTWSSFPMDAQERPEPYRVTA
jgi:hypothetical protein